MNRDKSTTHQVKDHYAEVAERILASLDDDTIVGCGSCCDAPMTGSEAAELYSDNVLSNVPAAAQAASRGCGDPVAKARIVKGERVLDLGSGGGIDALIAAELVGPEGHVFGLDMTDEMIKLATENAQTAGAHNVKFIKGLIEEIPLEDSSLDVVISNCVINLCERKLDAFRETRRVLESGGRMAISDIVAFEPIPEGADKAFRRLNGCLNGVNTIDEYERLLHEAGFENVTIEPKTIYTMDVLREKAERKDRMDSFAVLENYPEINGRTGSAIITAS